MQITPGLTSPCTSRDTIFAKPLVQVGPGFGSGLANTHPQCLRTDCDCVLRARVAYFYYHGTAETDDISTPWMFPEQARQRWIWPDVTSPHARKPSKSMRRPNTCLISKPDQFGKQVKNVSRHTSKKVCEKSATQGIAARPGALLSE